MSGRTIAQGAAKPRKPASPHGASFDAIVSTPHALCVDVLVLGAGLAGMRAAWAALEADPGLDVAVLAPGAGPSGSSFANVHNRLGMHVCRDAADRRDYLAEALAVAGSGRIDEALTAAVAKDSLERFEDMARLGVRFRRDREGGLLRFSSCFSPNSDRAVLFDDLAQAFGLFKDKIAALGGRFLSGWQAVELVRECASGAPVVGALCLSLDENQALFVRAKAVVLALGGPARLFRHAMSGPGTPGTGYALLRRAGAELVNAGFLQFLWGELPGRSFFNIADAAGRRTRVVTPDDAAIRPFERFAAKERQDMALFRSRHAPISHGLADAALDLALLAARGPEGSVRLRLEDGPLLTVAPLAHAGNGGARIDERGRTGVAGLLAAGECAGGMHGANRVGGAMVAAAQVFGARAGREAARQASSLSAPPLRDFENLAAKALAGMRRDPKARERGLARLKAAMQTHAVPGAGAEAEGFRRALEMENAFKGDWTLELLRESALAILEDQARTRQEAASPETAASPATRPGRAFQRERAPAAA